MHFLVLTSLLVLPHSSTYLNFNVNDIMAYKLSIENRILSQPIVLTNFTTAIHLSLWKFQDIM